MAETKKVLVNYGGAPARIISFEAAEAITAGTAMEIDGNGKVKMADTANILVAGFALTDAASGDQVSVITGSGLILYVHLDGTTDIDVGNNLVVAASDSGALSKSANVDGDSPVAIALEAATDTAANNLTAGALFKVLVK